MGPCRTCEREMRPQTAREWDAPGTVGYGADGQCRTCRARTNPKRETPKECNECGQALRPRSKSLKEMPGTKTHAGRGKCEACKQRGIKRARKRSAPVVVPPEDLVPLGDPDPSTVATLTVWEQRRQERIRRREQADRIRVEQEAVQRRFIASRRAA